MLIEDVLALLGVLLVLRGWQFHRELVRALGSAPSPPRLDVYPSVTVIRPIKGLDVGALENVRAALDPGYAGDVETLFVFDHDQEPALPVVMEAISQHARAGRRGTARVVFCGEPPADRTGKLNAMIVGMEQARGDLVAFVDSDVRPHGGALARVVETLLHSGGAGAAFAQVYVAGQPRTVGDAGYALLLNGLYGGAAAAEAVRERGELPFIMGQFMVFKREALSAIGGLATSRGQFVDDMYIGARVKAAGYRNMVAPCSVPIIQQGMSVSEFLKTYRRWFAFSISGIPWSFTVVAFQHGIVFWMSLGVLVLGLLTGNWLAVVAAGAAALAMGWSVVETHRLVCGVPLRARHAWVAFAILLSAPFVYLTIFLFRRVRWRGRDYVLDAGGHLAAGEVLAPGEHHAPPRRAEVDTPGAGG